MPYITPENVPDESTCRALLIPSSTDWLAIFSGALTELTKEYNWEQVDGITVEEALEVATSVVNGFYDGCVSVGCQQPGGYAVFRINENGNIEQLINGEWVPPEGIYAVPPVPEREEPTAFERRCLAAANAANVLEAVYEQITEDVGAVLPIAEVITHIVEVVVGYLFWLGPITAGIALLAIAALEIVMRGVAYLGADVWDSTFTDLFRCLLLECASDDAGVVTFDYDCVMGALLETNVGGDWTEERARLLVQLSYLIPIIGGGDGLNAAGATTEITEATCDDCVGGWCRLYDFTLSEYGFEPQLAGATPLANWSLGVGFQSIYINAGNGYRISAIAAPFAASVQYIEIGFELAPGTFIETGDSDALASDAFAQTFWSALASSEPSSPQTFCYKVLDPADPVDVSFQLLAQLFAGTTTDGSDPGGSVTIQYIKVMGVGAAPEDGIVCDWEDCVIE